MLGSQRPPSGSVIHQDLQNSEKLFYSQSRFITAEGDRLKSAKEGLPRTESSRSQAEASSCPLPVESRGSACSSQQPRVEAHSSLGVQDSYWGSVLEASGAQVPKLTSSTPEVTPVCDSEPQVFP